MIMPGNTPGANGAGDTVSFLTATVPNRRQLVFVHLVDPKPHFTPSASRTHAVVASTVEQMASHPGNVRSLRNANERFNIYYNANLGGLYSFYACLVGCPVGDQHAMLDRAPIEPSIRVQGDDQVYAYWLADRSYELREWQGVQIGLAKYFRSGRHLSQPSLVFPMPGFDTLHLERDGSITRTPFECVTFEPRRRYTARQMRKAFKKR